jgi:hypothetical protein
MTPFVGDKEGTNDERDDKFVMHAQDPISANCSVTCTSLDTATKHYFEEMSLKVLNTDRQFTHINCCSIIDSIRQYTLAARCQDNTNTAKFLQRV